MKKILLFTVAAATAMAFTGCSQSSELADTESNNTETTQKAISFDTYLSKTTRAGAAGAQNTEALKTNGFGVFAYYTGQNAYAKTTTPNFMYNTKVSVPTGSTAFTYSPARYWPNNDKDKLSFFAYAPYVEVTAGTGLPADVTSGITALSNNAYTGAPTVTYKLADDKTQSVDLLWGAKMGTTNGVNTDLTRTKNNVGFTFKHTLAKFGGDNSCIKAILVTDDDKDFDNTTKVTISDITITSSDIATTGTLDLTTGTWSGQNNDGKMTLDIPATAISEAIAEPKTTDKEIDGTAAGKLTGLQPTIYTNVLKENTASYYFIPGTQPKFDVTVTYRVRTIDQSLATGVTNVEQTIVKKTIQFPNAFEANKKYNLILSIGLNTVKFSAEVSDWASDKEAVTTTVNVPEVL